MEKRIFFWQIAIIALLIAVSSCSSNGEIQFKEGDLLFQNLDCGGLCDAIEAVTEGVDGKDFSHCAMVVQIDDSLMVVEAIGKGVQLTSIPDFFQRSNDTEEVKNITVARVKEEYQLLIPSASKFALQHVGEPYDEAFILDNGSWYCSELLYESFKHANNKRDFFKLYPMTYKVPNEEVFFPVWIDYYNDLNRPIPEGELGLNPGSISRSSKLSIISLN